MRRGLVCLALLAALAVGAMGCGAGSPVSTAGPPSSAPSTPAPTSADPTPVPVPAVSPAEAAAVPPVALMEVMLGIYSGRPNPQWRLTRDETDKLIALISNSPEVAGQPPAGGLGYYGFIVRVTPVEGNPFSLTVYAKTIAREGAAVTYRRDDAGAIERFLLATGQPTLTADEYALTKQALDDLLH